MHILLSSESFKLGLFNTLLSLLICKRISFMHLSMCKLDNVEKLPSWGKLLIMQCIMPLGKPKCRSAQESEQSDLYCQVINSIFIRFWEVSSTYIIFQGLKTMLYSTYHYLGKNTYIYNLDIVLKGYSNGICIIWT